MQAVGIQKHIVDTDKSMYDIFIYPKSVVIKSLHSLQSDSISRRIFRTKLNRKSCVRNIVEHHLSIHQTSDEVSGSNDFYKYKGN